MRKNSENASRRSRRARSVRRALATLAGVAGASLSLSDTASAGPAKITVSDVPPPVNVKINTPAQWKRVTIELTADQKAQLEKMGVKTDKLNITTYNLSQLAGNVSN